MARTAPVATPPVHPIAVLHRHVTALEAAITVTLASPTKQAVHRIRTATRRIEAQLTLLALLPGLPDHAKAADKVLRALGKLRREAGKVRDLDMQRCLLKEAPRQHSSVAALVAPHGLKRRAKALRRTLKHRRGDLAGELQQSLKTRSRSISRKLEKLLSALEPAEQTEISSTELASLTREWFRANMPDPNQDSTPDHLHSIRKAAKLARYLAESAVSVAGEDDVKKTRGQSAPGLAKHFATLQQSGGDWHDLLTLSVIVRHELGKRDPLTKELDRRCEVALHAYQKQLGHPPA